MECGDLAALCPGGPWAGLLDPVALTARCTNAASGANLLTSNTDPAIKHSSLLTPQKQPTLHQGCGLPPGARRFLST